MPVFKFVISDGKKSFQVEKEQKEATIIGKKLGDVFDGDFLGLSNTQLMITGGSDKDGFPMRKEIDGPVRKRVLLTKGVGFRGGKKGLKKRKLICGNTITENIVQINCKVVRSEKPIEEILEKKEGD